ncbi:MAG TPA: lipopolysaccharide biosynthesis protein RfbH [Alphaproteobacteria bacterium]|nr:lipopolysaccharide biosynthesis protein RfbH [Alphaproteobacteria bacterium]
MDKLQTILNLVDEYIEDKHSQKKWVAGKDWVQYAGPHFTSDEYIRSIKSLLSEWLVLGEDAMKFERKFPKFFGKSNGILTNSGSSANLLMMLAMTSRNLHNFPKGTKVITPIAGFPTTLNPIYQVGFEPVFVDIDLDTLNLNLDQVEIAARDSGAKIITFAHVLGNPPNMDRLMEIVDKYNLILLEDCCDALGSTYDGKELGSFGDMASCSFYPAHHITMGEGGFVSTHTPQEERVIRSFREWGRDCYCVGKAANLLKNGTCKTRFTNWLPSLPDYVFDHKYVYGEVGYNLKPIELQASMGLAQIDKLDEIHTRRKENYKALFNIFSNYEDHFHLPRPTKKSDPSWFAFPLTIRDNSLFSRWEITNFLEDAKIQTRQYFGGNIMLNPGYTSLMDSKKVIEDYPVARKITTDTFFLGTSPVIQQEQIEYIELQIHKFMKENKK